MSQIDLLNRNQGKEIPENIPEETKEDLSPTTSEGDIQGIYYNGKCGLFCFNPKWLQIFNHPLFYLISLCFFVIVQGSVATGFISVGLSSIERRYNLPSSLAAFAAISYEIGVIVTLPISTYFGGRSHKPRVLGISIFIMGIGSLIFASPHYFSGSYNIDANSSSEICTNASTFQSDCNPPAILFYPLFVIGNIIIGCGASTLYTVGVGFLDESTNPRYTPIFLSIFYIVSIIGPAIGFGLGGVFLSIFVDPFSTTTLTSSHPQWVGAWWIGFVFSGLVSILGSIQFFLYPRRLKNAQEYDKLRQSLHPLQSEGRSFENDHGISIITMIKEYPLYIRRLAKNPTFIFTTLAITAGAFVVAGIVTFLPKYVEIQYGLTPSVASYVIGGISIPAASLGILGGGLTLFVFKKLTVERLALLVFILTVIEVAIPPLFLLGCDSIIFAGVNSDYPNSTARTNFVLRNLNVSCLSSCDCRVNRYQPICSEGVNYFSPCLAGCPNEPTSNGTYIDCSCLGSDIVASQGKCTSNCLIQLFVSIVLLFLAVVLIFYNNIPFLKLTLRCVADKDRTVALGIQSVFFRVLGQLPGPLVIGAIFDLNCILWEETECGDRGACLEYNTPTLRYSLVGVMSISLLASISFFFLAWITWKYRKMEEK